MDYINFEAFKKIVNKRLEEMVTDRSEEMSLESWDELYEIHVMESEEDDDEDDEHTDED